MQSSHQQGGSAGSTAVRAGAVALGIMVVVNGERPASSTVAAQAEVATGAGVVVTWNEVGYELAYAEDQFLTFKGQRALALVNLAMHDALNSISPVYERYAYEGAYRDADAELAAAQAAHDVLLAQYPAAEKQLRSLLAEQRERSPVAALRETAIELGAAAADAILRVRDGDGWDDAGTYSFEDGAGRYRTTSDWDGFVLQPGFRNARPFATASVESFRPVPPPQLSDARYARDFEEVKAYGSAGSEMRTPEQTAYAVWWMEFAEGSVNRLARRLALEHHLTLWPAARMFAQMSMALFDGYIANWDSKYEYNHWRPVTAVRSAADDGNESTVPDPAWQSLRPAPPFPEYASAHATGCAAAFAVLASVWGDSTEFSMTTIAAPPEMPSRRFATFSDAAAECADSRVMLGWHFRYSTEAGLELGRRVAAHVLRTQLRQR